MGRGFISGTIWGAIVGVFILLVATQVAVRHDPLLPQPAPEAELTEVPDGSEFAEVNGGDEPVAPAPETAPAAPAELAAAPAVSAPPAEAPPVADAAPLPEPVTATAAPLAPSAPEAAPAPQVSRVETPETARPADAAAPDQPAGDAPLVTGLEAPAPPPAVAAAPAPSEVPASTEAATAVAPEPVPAETADAGTVAAEAPEAPQAEDAPGIAAADEPPAAPDAATSDPSLPDPSLPEPAAPEEDIAAASPPADQPRMITVPEAPAPPAEETPRWAAPPPNAPEAEDQQDETPGRAVVSAMPGERAGTLPGTLPGAAADPAAPAPDVADEAAVAGPGGAGALETFRTPFDAEADGAILSVVLMVPSEGVESVDALAALPVPVSYAIDALAPDARQTADTLRAAGRELLMVPSLPEGATPTDVEVALQANLSAVPEAVAFIDLPDASFQTDRTAVAQLVAAASASGHGLVTFPRGLNTAQQIARRDGVPSGLVFRDIDGEGQDADTIYRTLDQAAFRARQEGAVILVGRARPETLAVLTEWALGTRAASVSLAPVSAAILAQD